MSVPRLAKTAKILCIFGLLPTAVSFGQAPTPPTDFHAARASANRTSAASTAPADLQQQLASLRAQLAALQARLDTLERNAPLAQAAPAHVESAAANNMDKAAPATSSQPGPAAASADAAGQPPRSQTAKQPRPGASQPFSFADFSWLNGNSRVTRSPLDTPVFTGEFRADVSYIYDFNHPADDTLVGTTESGRTQEFQVQQLGVGGDFHYHNVRGRLMTQYGMYSTMTPRNDATPGRGQWNLADAYRYLSEAYGGYHFDLMHGVNVDAGIFMSYIGLFSYYNFDNWSYQPSYVSSNTPWFFDGLRVQTFPTDRLKVEFWLINGWQSYGRANHRPGLGTQIAWRPNGAVALIFNEYGVGADTVGGPARTRWHSDDSVELKYRDEPDNWLDRAALTFTADFGCESGGGVVCWAKGTPQQPRQYFIGAMAYNRFWLRRNLYGVTFGGGWINNPGRYLVLLPPINGATAVSGTPYFTENPGDPFRAWDASATFDVMPSRYITFRWEFDHRGSNVPYFAGPGGVTPPGGNTGAPGSLVPNWTPDLVKAENRLNMALLVMF